MLLLDDEALVADSADTTEGDDVAPADAISQPKAAAANQKHGEEEKKRRSTTENLAATAKTGDHGGLVHKQIFHFTPTTF